MEALKNIVCNREKTHPKLRNPTPISEPAEESEPESLEAEEPKESLPLNAIEIQYSEYELNIVVFFDKESIMARSRICSLGQFKLQPFLANAIKTAARKVSKMENDLKWINGRVEMRHKGLKKTADYLKNDIENDDDWNEVEKTLQAWMGKKYTNIRADLQLKFKVEVVNVTMQAIDESFLTTEQKKVLYIHNIGID